MTVEPAKRRRIGVGLAVLLTALLTSACAQGQHAQTAQESPALDAVNGDVGSMALRDASIATPTTGQSYPVGSAAQLNLAIVNGGSSDDNLVSITTSAASAVSLFGSASDATGALASTVSPSGSTSPSASASASPSSAAAALPFPLVIPAGERVSFGLTGNDKALVLMGLLKQLYPSNQITITFTFQNAGAVTLTVPVQLNTPTSSPLVIPPVSGAG